MPGAFKTELSGTYPSTRSLKKPADGFGNQNTREKDRLSESFFSGLLGV